jgi:two-component sensor histidine kinase
MQTMVDHELELRELRHRTSNNMQVVAALLRIQAREMTHIEAANALSSAAGRIVAFDRINKILDGRRAESIPRLFLRALVDEIQGSLVGARPIAIELDACADPVSCDVASAIGLIANELVINALKHAFPDNRPGIIRIQCFRDRGHLVLSVKDDGVGSDLTGEGFGIGLIRALISQLRGIVESGDATGVSWHIRVPIEASAIELPGRAAAKVELGQSGVQGSSI